MDEVNINMGSSFNHKRINHHSSVEQERALIWKKTCDNSDAKDSLLIKKELCGGHLLIRYFSFTCALTAICLRHPSKMWVPHHGKLAFRLGPTFK
jgi:hypothetical protein